MEVSYSYFLAIVLRYSLAIFYATFLSTLFLTIFFLFLYIATSINSKKVLYVSYFNI